jgi:glycogen debranching enzyme
MDWTEQARSILRQNDRGGYTIPVAGLYPYQWNWDASICALGWATFDEPRAWLELQTLLKGMWRTGPQPGLLPHIIFHVPTDTYFPGPQEWGTQAIHTPLTSSISQPPLHATIVRQMLARAKDQDLARRMAKEVVQALVLHHRWWYRDRDARGDGLVIITHPWESGMDNSPAWDAALDRVPPTTRAYTRKDLDHVDGAMRPKRHDYDRYVTLLDVHRQLHFDPQLIRQQFAFRVQDIGVISILHRASQDLLALCEQFDLTAEADMLRAALNKTQASINTLWSARLGQFASRDIVQNQLIEQPVISGFLPLYAGLGSAQQQAALIQTLEQWLPETQYGLPTTRKGSAAFEPQRYWRGPVWAHINWMIADGLQRAGRADLAKRLHASTRALFDAHGFCENYHPITGAGLGGRGFSWTASVALYWQNTP